MLGDIVAMTSVEEKVAIVDLTTSDEEIEKNAVVVHKRNRKHQG